jgi:dipeptidyl aminopeptidase/acylaminoacyl peptidase
MKLIASALSVLLSTMSVVASAQTAKPHDIEDFIRKQKFEDIKISPTGEYYAATVRIERKTGLAILRRADNKLMASMSIPGDRTHVYDFWWVNSERVLVSAAEKIGELERPQPTGELYAVNVDGKKGEMLVGQRLQGYETNTMIRTKKTEMVAAVLIDDLRNDDKNVIISVNTFASDPYTRAEKMDVYSGRRVPITHAPVRNASFITDNAGTVRLALGKDTDLSMRLYHRGHDGNDWKLVNDTSVSGLGQYPLGFSPDDKIVYLQVEQQQGPDAVVAWDIAADKKTEVFRDDNTDPTPIYVEGRLYGVRLMDGLPRTHFFDPQSPVVKLYRKMEKAFAGQRVDITSMTVDGKVALVLARGDRNPGDFFIFDATTNKAERLLGRKEWIDPERVAEVKPVSFKARDGLDIQGYLTVPVGSEARNSPLIVYIHGGPYNINDTWGFDQDAQILAAHGYAVLQVNYRGSGNHGRAFVQAGRREWGGKMQDDITDATKWAIQQGIADPTRICLFGASYGGYASLMGVAKEPALYRCAAGYVGVYDLPTMHSDGDIRDSGSGKTYINEWIGPKQDVASVSPTRLADRIKVPVFLAAGGEDERAPIQHTEVMEKALRKAGVPVEAVYYPTEGHGFYKLENEREFYGKLLSFFHRHLGGRAPVLTVAPAK